MKKDCAFVLKFSNLEVITTTFLKMHNLETNLEKILEIARHSFGMNTPNEENFYVYPRQPKCTDLNIIALAATAEALSIDSENLLYSKLRKEYPDLLAKLPDRTNYNRRKRRLADKIDELSTHLAEALISDSEGYIIDSMPVPVVRLARFPRLKSLKDNADLLPKMGYSGIDKTYYAGYKMHCIISHRGVIQNFSLTPANVSDVSVMPEMVKNYIADCTLIGDKGYISKNLQLDLFTTDQVKVVTPQRSNQKAVSQWNWSKAKIRKRIETMFSQFCDHLMIKRNYARSTSGFFSRIAAKVCAFTILQFINHLNNKPLNHVKHALAV